MGENFPNPMLPPVSVIIPVYNGEADLGDLIACLRSQSYPTNRVEYLLVNNNSSDRTLILLEEAAKDAAKDGITIRPLSENEIQSSYAARNKGIREANSNLLAFTDADCRPQSTWLESLVQPFNSPEIGIVAGEIIGLAGKSLLEKHASRNEVLSQKHTLAHPFFPYGQTANLAIRREAFQQVGLFRPYLTTGGDADICWRIQQQTEWKIEFAPNAIIHHRHRATLSEFKRQWRRYGCSNRYLHELHGIDLMPPLTRQYALYLLSRWLLKELPTTSLKAIAQKTNPFDIIKTPIDLIGYSARTQGQQTTQLPELARKIEWL
ncbi:MAG: glycosyltransferase [Cyanobacteriota bacterium]